MELNIYQKDTFASEVFNGNPAAVFPLKKWLPDETMQSIAMENNLSETAFFVHIDNVFHIRRFSRTMEVDLCGHATLASSYVIFKILEYDNDKIEFISKSGLFYVTINDGMYTLNFPTLGINEDPVTGSAYTQLAPYWATKLGKSKFHAKQVSVRGGELTCEVKGDHVFISGKAVKYMEGMIEL